MRTYQFSLFTIEYDPGTQFVTTKYTDGSECKVWPVDNDREFGFKVGVSPLEYKLMHELAHQTLAEYSGLSTCPIVWAQAHLMPMPHNAPWLEWQIMTISHFAFGHLIDYTSDMEGLKEVFKHHKERTFEMIKVLRSRFFS